MSVFTGLGWGRTAQLVSFRYWNETAAYKNEVYFLPMQRREKVASLHLPALGAALTVFVQGHAVPIGVKSSFCHKELEILNTLACYLVVWYATECVESNCGPNR